MDTRGKGRKVTCDDCFFRRNTLCALSLDEPCATFRPDSPEGLRPLRGEASDYDDLVVVVCNEGFYSSLAARDLRDLGFHTVSVSSFAERHGALQWFDWSKVHGHPITFVCGGVWIAILHHFGEAHHFLAGAAMVIENHVAFIHRAQIVPIRHFNAIHFQAGFA